MAPDDAPNMSAKDIVLDKGTVVDIPEGGNTIFAEMENGDIRRVGLDVARKEHFHLGQMDVGEETFWVFPSEQAFWDFWEWYIISSRVEFAFNHSDLHGLPNDKYLRLCRIFYQILCNDDPDFQAMSCIGCDYISEKDQAESPCQRCIRTKSLEDCWSGATILEHLKSEEHRKGGDTDRDP